MQKIRFVINDIARIFRLGDRDVPFNVRSVVVLIFFLLDSLELFSSWNDVVVSVGSIIFFYLQFLFQFVLLQSVFFRLCRNGSNMGDELLCTFSRSFYSHSGGSYFACLHGFYIFFFRADSCGCDFSVVSVSYLAGI